MAEETAGTAPVVQAQTQTNQGASTSQALTGSAPGGGQAQSEPAAPLKAPLIPDPAAFLERARARHGFVPKAQPGNASANPFNKSGTASSESSAKTTGPSTPQNEPAKKTDPSHTSTTVGTSPTESSSDTKNPEAKDDLADRVAKFSRAEREFAQQQAAFKAEQARAKAEREESAKQHEAKLKQAETVERAAKAIEAGDIAGALKALKADVNPSAIALQLLEQLQKEDERPMSPSEVDRIVADKLKAQEEARAKTEEEAKKKAAEDAKAADLATLEGARERYMEACSVVFSKDQYPFIAAHGLKREDVTSYAESQRDEHGRIHAPDPEAVLKHFEEVYRKRAEAAGWAPRAVEAPKPAPAPSFSQSSMVQDLGSRLVEQQPRKTLEEQRAEIRRRLRVGGVQT